MNPVSDGGAQDETALQFTFVRRFERACLAEALARGGSAYGEAVWS